jgi:hypothetical protein
VPGAIIKSFLNRIHNIQSPRSLQAWPRRNKYWIDLRSKSRHSEAQTFDREKPVTGKLTFQELGTTLTENQYNHPEKAHAAGYVIIFSMRVLRRRCRSEELLGAKSVPASIGISIAKSLAATLHHARGRVPSGPE